MKTCVPLDTVEGYSIDRYFASLAEMSGNRYNKSVPDFLVIIKTAWREFKIPFKDQLAAVQFTDQLDKALADNARGDAIVYLG